MPETPNQTTPPTSSTPAPTSGGSDKDARLWCMLCHLAALVPCIPCLLTVLIWQLKKAEFPAVDVHGKRALNFQISLLIVYVAAWIVCMVLAFIHLGFVMFLLPLLGLAALVLVIIAGVKAYNGEDYKYPWSLTLVK